MHGVSTVRRKIRGRSTSRSVVARYQRAKKNGFEVLKEISADPELCSLPVAILTTSRADEDIAAMYKLRCSSYVAKPVNFDKFAAVVRSITDYWFTVVELPLAGGK
jgi:response regulator RpfG family c-di-GMP phosphodiesterase